MMTKHAISSLPDHKIKREGQKVDRRRTQSPLAVSIEVNEETMNVLVRQWTLKH